MQNKADTRGLSMFQESLLRCLLARENYILEHGNSFWKNEIKVWGIPWKVREIFGKWTPSLAASASRALRRLENRGLVLRQNGWGGCPDTGETRKDKTDAHDRTTQVLLTEEGREFAERLTKIYNNFY
jgi:hypothetical protein